MNVLRRRALGLLLIAVMLGMAVGAEAQVLKQLPADPWAVIKFNNLQNISNKFAAMAQKLGLAQLDPAFANPLDAFKQQFGIQQGLKDDGELAIAMYPEERVLVLVPVTDYGAFLKTLPDVKTEGEISTLTLPEDGTEVYVRNWGSYAAMTEARELLDQKPVGIEVAGLAGKQLAGNDITAFVNMKVIGAQALPMFQAQREQILQELEEELAGGGEVPPQYVPAVKALVNQMVDFAERALKETQGATLSMNLVDQGINLTAAADLEPTSYLGQTVASIKNTDADLLAGLPDRKYFAYGGGALEPEVTRKVLNDFVAPVRKELENVEGAKSLLRLIDVVQTMLLSVSGYSTGWVVPGEGEKQLAQQVAVYRGDAQKLQAATRDYMQVVGDLMKLMPEGPEVKAAVNQDAVVVDDVKLDKISVRFDFDTTTPEGAQAAQAFAMIYGPEGINGTMGAINDKTFVAVVGGGEELVKETVAAAKGQESPLAQRANIKAVMEQLPKNRAAVFFVAVDNIVNQITQLMGQMGMAIPLKLPEDMPPIGVAVGTEGSAMRVDAHLSTELIGNLISAGIQTMQMMQPGEEQDPAQP